MGQVIHLLRPEEAVVIRCFRHLARFRVNYDALVLELAKLELNRVAGLRADALLSQALLVDRVLAEEGLAVEDAAELVVCPALAATDDELTLLDVVEAAQSSGARLEERLLRLTPGRRIDALRLLIRFGALLTAAGLRLPRRGYVAAVAEAEALSASEIDAPRHAVWS